MKDGVALILMHFAARDLHVGSENRPLKFSHFLLQQLRGHYSPLIIGFKNPNTSRK